MILPCPTLEGCWINLQYLAYIAVADSNFPEFDNSQRNFTFMLPYLVIDLFIITNQTH